MANVFVGIGSNIDKHKNVVSAVRDLATCFDRLRMSPVYESEAMGFDGDNFYNLVISFHTELSPAQVAQALDKIERGHGRCRERVRFVSRTLDLDQLLYDDLVTDKDGICLPHADITACPYVLLPLTRLASLRKHPVLNKTYAQLWLEQGGDTELNEVTLPELADIVALGQTDAA